ncbi:hypothetical protein BUALT_Bualt12G0025500 [Buddleja alternifolia]|uniref:Uncharacterized protein n=1 Tax=Buddleja alternifolia TaxID=168488 RepID=A0AAV6WUF5_9LAMI|nr:hypothetical protein BUALT_Bualt12G0025500 [Buddleja alternifolia]
MAGLQYKFFPTDFLFPLQPPPAAATTGGGGDNPSRQVSLIKTRNGDVSDDSKQLKSVNTNKGKIVKAIPSSSVAFAPIIHKQN